MFILVFYSFISVSFQFAIFFVSFFLAFILTVVNEFTVRSFLSIFVFVNENHTADLQKCAELNAEIKIQNSVGKMRKIKMNAELSWNGGA